MASFTVERLPVAPLIALVTFSSRASPNTASSVEHTMTALNSSDATATVSFSTVRCPLPIDSKLSAHKTIPSGQRIPPHIVTWSLSPDRCGKVLQFGSKVMVCPQAHFCQSDNLGKLPPLNIRPTCVGLAACWLCGKLAWRPLPPRSPVSYTQPPPQQEDPLLSMSQARNRRRRLHFTP